MKKADPISRRNFLSAAAAGAGTLFAANALPVLASEEKSGWIDKKQINPNIDNLRVVSCCDPKMISADPRKWDMASQNAPVIAERVQANMDALACGLAQKKTAHEAWGSIFRKPASKEWQDVKVAIKLNCLGDNHPRVAVVNSVCRALVSLGAAPGNIVLYDGVGNAGPLYRSFVGSGIVAGVAVSDKNELLGGMTSTQAPKPHAGSFKCTAAIANGTIDILVNIAVNKGTPIAGMTMTMKNHAGTFEPMPIHLGGGLNYIIAFSKSEALLGGDPVRQQLCIVDSIWANTGGPFGVPNKRPCMLAMGTFSPAVDYVIARRVREPLMGCKHPPELSKIMSEFGYANFETLDMVKVEPPA
jgi:hypothetical protein